MFLLNKEQGQFMNNKGFTLIEGIISLLLLGLATMSLLSLYITNTASSADDMEYRQSVQLAKSLMEEILAKPYTYCDLDDVNFLTATSTASCSIVENMGPEAGESRYSNTSSFDNVNDYDGFSMNSGNGGIKDIAGNVISGLNNYSLTVAVSSASLGGVPNSNLLKVTVTVNTGRTTFVLDGYRSRYAPNS